MGLGTQVSSDIILIEHEDKLFQTKVLGCDSAEQLLNTVIYMMGMHLALTGGVEHNRLRRPGFNSQIVVGTDSRGKECLIYNEDPLHKTNQGGLKCIPKKKVMYVYPSANVQRCPVNVFKKYIRLLPAPKSCAKLYLRARQKPTPNIWFCDQPLGSNKVSSAVKNMCKKAGLVGKFTNHSLRATSASRMYHCGIPEQMIKEVTGHKSDCVRFYKRTCDDIREKASKTITTGGVTNKISVKSVKVKMVGKKSKVETDKNSKQSETECDVEPAGHLSMTEMVKNVIKTKAEIAKKNLGVKFNIAKCKNLIARKIIKNSKVRQVLKRAGQNRITIDVNDVNVDLNVVE